MLARLAVGPSILAVVAALALGAAPAEAQRLSRSPTIGVYIPTSELVKASQGQKHDLLREYGSLATGIGDV